MMEYYYISSCSSNNKKQLDRLLRRRHLLRWSPTTTDDDDDDDDDALAAASAAPSRASEKSSSSTEMLMRMAAPTSAAKTGAQPPRRWPPRPRSSFGSCVGGGGGGGWWSVGDCPPTPSSPFCSPLASSSAAADCGDGDGDGNGNSDNDNSFATPYQSSCIVSCDARRSHASREKEVEEVKERKMAANGSFEKLLHPKKLQSAMNPSLMHIRRASCTATEEEEEEEEEEERGSSNKLHPISAASSPLSSACNWHSDSDGTYYTGGSGSGSGSNDSSEYENSGSESSTWQPAGSRRCRCFSARSIRSEVEAKLLAWKEARISKLMNKLRKKEAAINEWEQLQITKAKQNKKELEMKLEKRRTMAMEEMQWRMMVAHEKATRKKMKEQAAAAMRISNVDHTFEDISNNKKLPWRLFFLCSSMYV